MNYTIDHNINMVSHFIPDSENLPFLPNQNNWNQDPFESCVTVVDYLDPHELDCEQSTMSEKIVPHENDILMGRGGKNNQHVGNEKLRKLARRQSENYRMSSKKGKSYISRELVQAVRKLSPPGRFLKKKNTGEWVDVGDDVAREKASQVLRDAVAVCTTSSNEATETELDESMETMSGEHRRSSSAPPAIKRRTRRRRDWEEESNEEEQKEPHTHRYGTRNARKESSAREQPTVTPVRSSSESTTAKRRRFFDMAWVDHDQQQQEEPLPPPPPLELPEEQQHQRQQQQQQSPPQQQHYQYRYAARQPPPQQHQMQHIGDYHYGGVHHHHHHQQQQLQQYHRHPGDYYRMQHQQYAMQHQQHPPQHPYMQQPQGPPRGYPPPRPMPYENRSARQGPPGPYQNSSEVNLGDFDLFDGDLLEHDEPKDVRNIDSF